MDIRLENIPEGYLTPLDNPLTHTIKTRAEQIYDLIAAAYGLEIESVVFRFKDK